jgi:hypothetical protein
MGGGMEASAKMHEHRPTWADNQHKLTQEKDGMVFDEEMKVITSTLNDSEARAFVKFLESEILRHQIDIDQAKRLISRVKAEHGD